MKNKTQEELEVYFYFKITDLVKKKFGCEMGGGTHSAFVKSVAEKYRKAGSPRAALKWLEGEDFLSEFVSMNEPPVWYDRLGINSWPFHDGWPMIFFGQLTSILEGINHISGKISILVFGYKENVSQNIDDGFTLHLITKVQNMDDDNESIEEHYRKEARRMRDQARRAKKKAEEDVKE